MPSTENNEDILTEAIINKKVRNYEKAHRLYKTIYKEYMNDPNVVYDYASVKLALARQRVGRKYKNNIDVRKKLTHEALELLRRGLQLFEECEQKGWCWFELARALAFLHRPKNEIENAYIESIRLSPNEKAFKESFNRWKEITDN
jgi:tetratricopeptide (TPR) repeat protein